MIFIQRKKWENSRDLDEVFGKMLHDTFKLVPIFCVLLQIVLDMLCSTDSYS